MMRLRLLGLGLGHHLCCWCRPIDHCACLRSFGGLGAPALTCKWGMRGGCSAYRERGGPWRDRDGSIRVREAACMHTRCAQAMIIIIRVRAVVECNG